MAGAAATRTRGEGDEGTQLDLVVFRTGLRAGAARGEGCACELECSIAGATRLNLRLALWRSQVKSNLPQSSLLGHLGMTIPLPRDPLNSSEVQLS